MMFLASLFGAPCTKKEQKNLFAALLLEHHFFVFILGLCFWGPWTHWSTALFGSHLLHFHTCSWLGVKKKLLFRFPTDPIFFCRPYYFFKRLTMRPYFLWVVAGCCQNGVGCHTNYRKNIEKKIISDLTDPNFFAI